MADYTISNVSQLQRALSSMSVQHNQDKPPSPTPDNNSGDSTMENSMHTQYQSQLLNQNRASTPNGKARLSSSNYSSHDMLANLAALQTTTNTKVDALIDAVIRLEASQRAINTELTKQSEILAVIARNTAFNENMVQRSGPITPGKNSTTLPFTSYGFKDVIELMAELLINILKQAEIKIRDYGRQYRSTRDINSLMLQRAIKVAAGSEYKINGVIETPVSLPSTKASGTIFVASRIGSIDNMSTPILTPIAIRELLMDTTCRPIVESLRKIIDRLRITRILLPFYEADIINAIKYPYFNGEGQLICEWEMIVPRNETPEEARVMSAKVTDQKEIGKMIARGIRTPTAIRTVLKS